MTTSSETAFARAPETLYDFVTNPANWTKTYPGSAHITNLPDELSAEGRRHLAGVRLRQRPNLHLASGDAVRGRSYGCSIPLGGLAMTVMATVVWKAGSQEVSTTSPRPGEELTLFTRTMTIEAYKHAPLPDAHTEQEVNPAKIDAYHAGDRTGEMDDRSSMTATVERADAADHRVLLR